MSTRMRYRGAPRWILALVAALGLVLAGCGGDQEAEETPETAPESDLSEGEDESVVDDEAEASEGIDPVTIRAVSAWPIEDPVASGMLVRLSEVAEELSDGAVTIELAGGPEVVNPFDLAASATSGAVDMAWLSAAYYIPELPEAAILDYTELTIEEEREFGAWDYINQIHNERMDVELLGRGGVGWAYALHTTEPIEELSDFEGLRIRVSPVYVPFLQALGAETISMPGGEIYTSLERGVIDGFAWGEAGAALDLQTQDVLDYKILPSFWTMDIVTIVNLDVWEGLDEAQQDVLVEAMRVVEAEGPDYYAPLLEQENELMRDAGVEIIELEGDVADEYLETAKEAGWDWIRQNVAEDSETLIDRFSQD